MRLFKLIQMGLLCFSFIWLQLGSHLARAADAPIKTPDRTHIEKMFKDINKKIEKAQEELFKDFDQSTFFGNFTKDKSELTSTFSFSGPKQIDMGDEVKILFSVPNQENGKYDVQVNPKTITLTGKGYQSSDTTKKSKKGPQTEVISSSEWTVSQAYPIPSNLDVNHYKVERSPDEVSVIFQKLKK